MRRPLLLKVVSQDGRSEPRHIDVFHSPGYDIPLRLCQGRDGRWSEPDRSTFRELIRGGISPLRLEVPEIGASWWTPDALWIRAPGLGWQRILVKHVLDSPPVVKLPPGGSLRIHGAEVEADSGTSVRIRWLSDLEKLKLAAKHLGVTLFDPTAGSGRLSETLALAQDRAAAGDTNPHVLGPLLDPLQVLLELSGPPAPEVIVDNVPVGLYAVCLEGGTAIRPRDWCALACGDAEVRSGETVTVELASRASLAEIRRQWERMRLGVAARGVLRVSGGWGDVPWDIQLCDRVRSCRYGGAALVPRESPSSAGALYSWEIAQARPGRCIALVGPARGQGTAGERVYVQRTVVIGADGLCDREIEVPPPTELTVVALDAETGAPVPLRCLAWCSTDTTEWVHLASVDEASGSSFVSFRVCHGDIFLTASADGYAPWTAVVCMSSGVNTAEIRFTKPPQVD